MIEVKGKEECKEEAKSESRDAKVGKNLSKQNLASTDYQHLLTKIERLEAQVQQYEGYIELMTDQFSDALYNANSAERQNLASSQMEAVVLKQDNFGQRTPLIQLKLTREAVEVSVHDSSNNGGGTREEWPWKLLIDAEGASDKWFIRGGAPAWINYRFKQPILIRGYGVKSANDFDDRDPKSFEFLVQDALDKRDPS